MSLLITLAILLAGSLRAQVDTSAQYRAGVELQRFYQKHTVAIGCYLVGGILVTAGALNSTSSASEPMIYAGAALGVIGFIVNEIAFSKIKKAGIIFAGNKIIYPINTKHK